MPLKLFGALALAAAGILAGGAYAQEKKRAIAQLGALQRALAYLSAQIAMLRTPLPDLLCALAEIEGCAALFRPARELLESGAPFSEAAQAVCARIGDERAAALLHRVLAQLETAQAREGAALLDAAQAELAQQKALAEREDRDKTPLARRIALSAAILAAILLL